MQARTIYLILCIAGTVVPYSRLIPFLREHGLDPRLFIEQMFATDVAGFFALDVVISALALWVFVAVEGRRTRTRHLWAPVAASLAVGVSLALPLFLYMREKR